MHVFGPVTPIAKKNGLGGAVCLYGCAPRNRLDGWTESLS
jgi:hypothetical protein